MMSGTRCQEMWLLASTLGGVNSVGALNIGLSYRRENAEKTPLGGKHRTAKDAVQRRLESLSTRLKEREELGRMTAAREWRRKPLKVTSIVGATFLAFGWL